MSNSEQIELGDELFCQKTQIYARGETCSPFAAQQNRFIIHPRNDTDPCRYNRDCMFLSIDRFLP